MTIDDLPLLIPTEHADLQIDLARWITDWKRSEDDIERLRFLVDKWLGNVWINDENAFKALMQAWQTFKAESLDRVRALTVNERLFIFGLFEQWDASGTEGHKALMAKVHANA
jgi:hypothetical protein